LFDIEHPAKLEAVIGYSNIGFPDLLSLPDDITEAAALWVETEQYKIVGACLAAARRRANVTQQELAARLGKPQSFVSEYERGQRRVDVVEFLVISLVLGVEPVELFVEISEAVAPS
jgi:DNA-binding transcriptional regulator YiaG